MTTSPPFQVGTTAALADLGLDKYALSLASLENHIDDIGITLLAAPYAGALLGNRASKSHNKKMRHFGHKITKLMGVNSSFGQSHARELLGLALVTPTINKFLAHAVDGGITKLPKFKLSKLGMQLNFDNPQQAAQHAQTRGTVGAVAGFGGSIAGGVAGGALGSAMGGPAGGIAGNVAGGYLGEQMTAKPAQLAYDVQHDVRQRTNAGYNNTMGQLNNAAGLPTGGRM